MYTTIVNMDEFNKIMEELLSRVKKQEGQISKVEKNLEELCIEIAKGDNLKTQMNLVYKDYLEIWSNLNNDLNALRQVCEDTIKRKPKER